MRMFSFTIFINIFLFLAHGIFHIFIILLQNPYLIHPNHIFKYILLILRIRFYCCCWFFSLLCKHISLCILFWLSDSINNGVNRVYWLHLVHFSLRVRLALDNIQEHFTLVSILASYHVGIMGTVTEAQTASRVKSLFIAGII